MESTRISDVIVVGIPVRDQDRALAFYVDTLGFQKRLDGSFAGPRGSAGEARRERGTSDRAREEQDGASKGPRAADAQRRQSNAASRWLTVAPAGANTSIALVAADRAGVDTGIRFGTADAAADHAHLLASGVDVDPEVLRYPGVPPMFTFRDVDDNILVVVEI